MRHEAQVVDGTAGLLSRRPSLARLVALLFAACSVWLLTCRREGRSPVQRSAVQCAQDLRRNGSPCDLSADVMH